MNEFPAGIKLMRKINIPLKGHYSQRKFSVVEKVLEDCSNSRRQLACKGCHHKRECNYLYEKLTEKVG